MAVAGCQVPSCRAVGIQHRFNHWRDGGAATGAEFVDFRFGAGHVVGACEVVGGLLQRGGHDEVTWGQVQLFGLQAFLQAHAGAACGEGADGQRAGGDQVGMAACGGDCGGVKQCAAVCQVGIGGELAVNGAVFQAAGGEAKGGHHALESAQVVIDDGLTGEGHNAAIGQHGVGFSAVGHGTVFEFTSFVGLQQVWRTSQLHDAHVFEVRRVGCPACPQGVSACVFVVGAAQALVGHVGEQGAEVRRAHWATGAEVEHAAGERHAVKATGVLSVGFQEVAAHFDEAQAPVLAAIVVQLGAGGYAVQNGLLNACHANGHFVLHGFDAAHIAVATRCAVAAGKFIQHGAAGLLDGVASADHAAGQLRYAVAGAQVNNVGSAGVGCGNCGGSGCGERCGGGCRRNGLGRGGGAAVGVDVSGHGASFCGWGWGCGGNAHRGR